MLTYCCPRPVIFANNHLLYCLLLHIVTHYNTLQSIVIALQSSVPCLHTPVCLVVYSQQLGMDCHKVHHTGKQLWWKELGGYRVTLHPHRSYLTLTSVCVVTRYTQ